MEVEDHSLSWGEFEGVLEEGSYGAGTVLVWDRGTYTNLSQANGKVIPMERALERGRLAFRLEGRKLRGSYTLTRFGPPAKRQWLLTKLRDAEAEARDALEGTQSHGIHVGNPMFAGLWADALALQGDLPGAWTALGSAGLGAAVPTGFAFCWFLQSRSSTHHERDEVVNGTPARHWRQTRTEAVYKMIARAGSTAARCTVKS